LVLALGAPLGWLTIEGALLRPAAAWSQVRAAPGIYLYLLLATALAFSAFGAVLGRLSDAVEARNHQLEALALTDALTGLANVRGFRAQLELECARARRGKASLAVVMIDLDHFKRVNDAHGHAVGDLVLAQAARLLAGATRRGDFAARIGGEEFAVLCPGQTLDEASRMAERARAAIEAAPVSLPGGAVPVTASFGVAVLRGTPDALLASADRALYEAKHAGRNRVVSEAA